MKKNVFHIKEEIRDCVLILRNFIKKQPTRILYFTKQKRIGESNEFILCNF